VPNPSRCLPLLLVVACAPAFARPPENKPDNLLDDRFGLQFALVNSSASTTVRFDADNGTLGTVLSAEDDLGLKDTKLLARGDVWFRMRERHRMRLSNYVVPLDRNGDTVLNRTIQFGNSVYAVNERVTSKLKVNLMALAYTYSVVKNDRIEAGLSFGFDVVGFEAEATVPARLRTEREERSGPAPLLGVDFTGRIVGKWYAEARAQFLRVNISDVKGSLSTWEVNGLYRLHPNVTVGLGYNSFAMDVDSVNTGDSGRFKLTTRGPMLLARVGF
jgi:hypothetical protein